jgi:hypothetical protein
VRDGVFCDQLVQEGAEHSQARPVATPVGGDEKSPPPELELEHIVVPPSQPELGIAMSSVLGRGREVVMISVCWDVGRLGSQHGHDDGAASSKLRSTR